MTGDLNLHNQFRENPTQNVTRCGKGAPDFARMLTGTNSSRIISDTSGNKHLATMLVTRTDFEDVGVVGGYMSSGQKCHESVRATTWVARCLFPNVSEIIRELLVPVNILAKSGAPSPHPGPGDRDLVRPPV